MKKTIPKPVIPVDKNEKTFETESRRLENFLYAHKIEWAAQKKAPSRLNVWIYNVSDELIRVVDEFISIHG